MNVEIGTEAAPFPGKEKVIGIFVAVVNTDVCVVGKIPCLRTFNCSFKPSRYPLKYMTAVQIKITHRLESSVLNSDE
jgi:hypothetical protein